MWLPDIITANGGPNGHTPSAQEGRDPAGKPRLLLPGGDGGVARDEGGHDAAGRLDAQRQRRHVQQQQVLHLAARLAPQDGRLHDVRINAKEQCG